MVWGRADTALWLDYPFLGTFMRLLWRTLRRLILREELWNGNRESLTMMLSGDSILLWAVTSHPRYNREYAQLMNDPEYAHVRFLRHRSPRETEDWLKSLTD
ncbi:hypothetical protein ES703_82781 [subsurface metagenome]